MTRVSVPDDYDGRDVPLPDDGDFSPPSLRGYTGRVAQVRSDGDGRYVGVPEYLADDVADYLGVEYDDAGDGGNENPTELPKGKELELANDYIREQIDAGVCPWCDDYEGDSVPQHASSAHPDEWSDYKGGE